ncbi:Oidioi.mRNA.OKI2018_I69.chr1.g2467.t1.cds [Oikopleura dioica]|uniref:Oidioi.mRNA.OKI2018_I69.chr1.g2467.t1.cds n=1 Tax=Oikopleura dioica TaxID=34765 RepID=A0ABN7SUP6_OIKDI|nr:Oidioi.mRNA.OKI2018_I69.chr1.g2467.t1.cds [Oikopleura dioica]
MGGSESVERPREGDPCCGEARDGDFPVLKDMSSTAQMEEELALVSVNESNSATYDILLKIMALGDTGVGKSCFLVQYVEGRFMMKYVTTVGVDFFLRKLTYEHSDWEKEKSNPCFLRDGMGFLLLFDLTNIESFRHTESWIEEIREKTICEDPDIILVGNKSDMEDKRQVPRSAAISLAEAHNIPYIETSAATGENVQLAVNLLLHRVMQRLKKYMRDIRYNYEEEEINLNQESSSCSLCSKTTTQ